MKFRLGTSNLVKDVKKARGTLTALRKTSQQKVREQLKAARDQRVLKRSAPVPTAPQTKVTVKLNAVGNRTGMHNADHPPDSSYMRRIRGMRRFYNKQMPVLACSSCSFAASCPQFKAGYECAFLPFLNSHRVETTTDLVEYMKEMCGASMRRAHLMTLFETLSGAPPSLEASEALGIAFEQLSKLHQTMTETGAAEVSIETTDGGILGKLFGGVNNLLQATKQAHLNPIEVPAITTQQIADRAHDSATILSETEGVIDQSLIKEHSTADLEDKIGRKLKAGLAPISVSKLSK